MCLVLALVVLAHVAVVGSWRSALRDGLRISPPTQVGRAGSADWPGGNQRQETKDDEDGMPHARRHTISDTEGKLMSAMGRFPIFHG
jgi:hypothetical protein